MSGIHCGNHLPFGLLDVSSGFNVDLFSTRQERAEFAIRTTWQDMDDAARAAWLRKLADDIEAEARKEAEREAKRGAWIDKAAARFMGRGGMDEKHARAAAAGLWSNVDDDSDPEAAADEDMNYWENDEAPT